MPADNVSLGLAFMAGMLSFVSPCVLPLFPSYLSYITGLSYEEIKNSEGPSPTYVPFRNANLLSIATAIAQIQKCDIVYFGAHADDAHNYAYPDCTPEFIGAMANAINVGTYYTVRLKTPIMWMTKGEVVAMGSNYNIPFELTYSCYEGTEIHCGECPTCISRQVAFEEARVDDPTEYAVQSFREKTFHG